ncbi:5-formyltetrahydrofolate cyclo-ligase [Arachidicoccus ginsenosidimutans]|uniref:5-formyltetrahydrofolate cyclo-ligase n=1 Tax=Arachidicoccus sp. BS20 TaxID=1850526 RepID=UPI0007F14557|nr:5-formyltetrahydrofolate cyclo-ligase [Arachidicoccus sp. BS20]ANI88400.1 5-formyltetrahydrofolate cyclo-ligase [Arachidicoccus sp. BS20]
MTKQELRKIYLEKRMSISSKEKLKLDDLLLIQFQRLSFDGVQVLMSYFPMAEKNEPNTLLFSNYLRHAIPNLEIAFPKSDFTSNEMQAVLIDEETVYQKNNYQITEPTSGKIIKPTDIDLIFVPLVMLDSKGFRVGYGKGFYDKFLSKCREDVLKIGFSYFSPVEEISDVQEFDIPLDYCITPDKVYEF